VTVAVYGPAVPEHDRVEVPVAEALVRVILAGEVTHVRPVDGKIVVDNETEPARP
jgi:hypothetical protein